MDCLEPSARTGPFSASINSSLYLWGGYTEGNTQHLSKVYRRNLTSTWQNYSTERPLLPDGYYAGACTSVGSFIYTYGGWSLRGKDTGCLFELDTRTFQWRELTSADAVGGPMKKVRSGMIGYKDSLLLFGGYNDSSHRIQPGSQYLLGFTNECHSYDLITGKLALNV